jgi:hypothetical protein
MEWKVSIRDIVKRGSEEIAEHLLLSELSDEMEHIRSWLNDAYNAGARDAARPTEGEGE